ncbi:hypothetical protein GCM10009837_48620 [Streptomyces durmitorensis]|uniref:Uncharacterized protein n=1 Tax=Streptomyces durmitorensis TaxID=319947 RepID=A0ABY4Q564_9ACTN|nr:hypothetical protein [Streptomyces durmitorensis]UQT60178.1 hypothetical protein M4V62_36815 [Streptomyces durmitorensis]
MQQSAAAWLVQIALVIRVFGPDVIRGSRRILTAGVRVGITNLTSSTRNSPPVRSSDIPQDTP